MGDQKLTRRQRQILDYIGEFESSNGYAPSYREIGEHFGLSSPATIHQHVQSLQEKGFLRSEHNSARSIELVKFKTNWAQAVDLMLAGLITAGEPIEAVEEHERIAVPADMAPHPDNSFVLKVKGDSMVDDGILDGDFVVSHRLYDTKPTHPLMNRIYTFDMFRLNADGKAVEHWDVMDDVPSEEMLAKMN